MICQYNLWLITFVLGYVLCGLWRPWKARGLRTWEASLANARCQWENSAGSDVIIVGAGVAGSALAYALGKDGHQVHVIERDLTMTNRIVGELLQPEGYLKLLELGLEDSVTEIDAQQVLGYVVYKDGKHTRASYPLKDFNSDVAGKSFHHGRFIQRMRKNAAFLPNVRFEQGTVTSMIQEKETFKGVLYKTMTGQVSEAHASLTIVCDGCFSNLRRFLCKSKVCVTAHTVGWPMENCQLPYPIYGHITLASPSPILFYPISSTETRCFVGEPGQHLPSISNSELSHYMITAVVPKIPPELYNAFISTINEGNFRTLPDSSLSATPNNPTPGAILMGDALNTRHPLTGGGMTVTLSDVVVLRDLLRPLNNLNDASALCEYLQSFYTLRKPMAITMNTLAATLQRVFCIPPDNEVEKEVRQAIFNYFSLGGNFASALVAFLAGLNPQPLSIAFLFFYVAIYSIGRLLLPFPTPKSICLIAKLIWGAPFIFLTSINANGNRQMSFLTKKVILLKKLLGLMKHEKH